MMISIKHILVTPTILLLIFFSSCKGDDGDIGPMGIAGQDGSDGQDGNSNVIKFHLKDVIIEKNALDKFIAIFQLKTYTNDIYDFEPTDLTNIKVSTNKVTYYNLPGLIDIDDNKPNFPVANITFDTNSLYDYITLQWANADRDDIVMNNKILLSDVCVYITKPLIINKN